MEGTVVPSKFYSALAVARSVIFIGPAHSEPAQVIARSGCGIRIEPGDTGALVKAVQSLRGEPGVRMGRAGHALFLKEFERQGATARMARCLTLVLSGRSSPPR